jgi:trimeric autotransporter adhesin
MNRKIKLLGIALLSLALVACGGGSGGNSGGGGGGGTQTGTNTGGGTDTGGSTGGAPAVPPAAPTVSAGYGVKQVLLNWGAVSGATHYRVLKKPDAVSGFSQVGADLTGTGFADTLAVHLTDWVNVSYLVEACNSAGCTASSAISGLNSVPPIGYVKAFNTEAYDNFGYAVAISGDGNTLAIGAIAEDSNATGVGDGGLNDNTAQSSGAVYLYVRDAATGVWGRQAYLKASNSGVDSYYFGGTLSLSADGNTLAVGAFAEDGSAVGINGPYDNGALNSGAAYVFVRSGHTWTQQAYVKASNTGVGDLFGSALSLSADGNTLAVGAYREDGGSAGIGGANNNSLNDSGAVYVFARSGGTWAQQAYVKSSNPDAIDQFGYALSLSADGNTLAVGAPGEDSSATGVGPVGAPDALAANSGAVYLYRRVGGFWSEQAYVKASNTGGDDQFGRALTLSADGKTLAVSAPMESSGAIGIGGDQGDNSAPQSGAVYLFTQSGSTWSQQAYVKASNTQNGDWFGASPRLSADGNTLAVGATYEASSATGIGGNQGDNSASDSGAVYVFARKGDTWVQRNYVKSPNTGAIHCFGTAYDMYTSSMARTSIALSADGKTLAVGADGEASNALNIGGDPTNTSAPYAGAVYLY